MPEITIGIAIYGEVGVLPFINTGLTIIIDSALNLKMNGLEREKQLENLKQQLNEMGVSLTTSDQRILDLENSQQISNLKINDLEISNQQQKISIEDWKVCYNQIWDTLTKSLVLQERYKKQMVIWRRVAISVSAVMVVEGIIIYYSLKD